MQNLFIVLLICVLAAAVGSFAVMAIRQHRRTARLAQKAYQLNMRFAAADPFDIPRRFSRFAVISAGHSPSASNASYGTNDMRVICEVPVRHWIQGQKIRAAIRSKKWP